VWKEGDLEAWTKPLSGGRRAVLLFNRGTKAAPISVDWDRLGYPATLKAQVRDLWTHKDLPAAAGSVSATVQPHDVVMLLVAP